MSLVLLLAPGLLGLTRKVRARALRRRGAPLLQPYRDLLRLLRKEVVLAESASWLFRAAPYAIFAATWVAAALVPTSSGFVQGSPSTTNRWNASLTYAEWLMFPGPKTLGMFDSLSVNIATPPRGA